MIQFPLDIKGFSFHHIGLAVFKIEDTAKFYEATGWQRIVETAFDPCQNVRACFYAKQGFPTTELIEAVDEKSPIRKILSKSGVGPYHYCFAVDNLQEAISQLRSLKFIPTGKPVPSVGMPGRKVCFLYNMNYGLIELVESEKTL